MIVLYTFLVLVVGTVFVYVISSILQDKREYEKRMEEKRKQKEAEDALAKAQHLALLGIVKEQAEPSFVPSEKDTTEAQKSPETDGFVGSK